MSTSDSSITNANFKQLSHRCRICDAPADYSHFGVISCSSCKIFFRRNGNISPRKFTCDFDGHCEININTRHVCTACRLAKCLKCGMSCDLFRGSKIKETNTKMLVKTSVQPQLPTLNLLQSDTSLLTKNQWNLLSNLVKLFEESQLISISQRLMDTNDVINVTFETLLKEWVTCCYETTGTYLCLNRDLCQLPTDDRSIILHSAADNVSCMVNALVIQNYPLYNLNAFCNTIISLYGKDVTDRYQWGMKFMDSDMIVIKLALSLFAFSEITYSYYSHGSTNLTNPINILKIQNKYAEITWKYLLYRYGDYEAVKRFVNIISWLGATIRYIPYLQNISSHVNEVNSLVEQTELKLLLDDVDDIMKVNETSS